MSAYYVDRLFVGSYCVPTPEHSCWVATLLSVACTAAYVLLYSITLYIQHSDSGVAPSVVVVVVHRQQRRQQRQQQQGRPYSADMGLHRRRVWEIAKGFRGRARNCIKIARQQAEKALQHAYKGRKDKKKDMRALWIQRVNAAAREHGVS